eukprot:4487917-Prymnesium_polylepis.1
MASPGGKVPEERGEHHRSALPKASHASAKGEAFEASHETAGGGRRHATSGRPPRRVARGEQASKGSEEAAVWLMEE